MRAYRYINGTLASLTGPDWQEPRVRLYRHTAPETPSCTGVAIDVYERHILESASGERAALYLPSGEAVTEQHCRDVEAAENRFVT